MHTCAGSSEGMSCVRTFSHCLAAGPHVLGHLTCHLTFWLHSVFFFVAVKILKRSSVLSNECNGSRGLVDLIPMNVIVPRGAG